MMFFGMVRKPNRATSRSVSDVEPLFVTLLLRWRYGWGAAQSNRGGRFPLSTRVLFLMVNALTGTGVKSARAGLPNFLRVVDCDEELDVERDIPRPYAAVFITLGLEFLVDVVLIACAA